jgi:hypothetical protein
LLAAIRAPWSADKLSQIKISASDQLALGLRLSLTYPPAVG